MAAAISRSCCRVGAQRKRDAQALALAVDGAIVQAQMAQAPDVALKSLERLVGALLKSAA
jgi:hypothetical protein